MDKINRMYLGRYGVIKLFLYLCLAMGVNIVHASNSTAYISGASEPWGHTSYKSAMDTVFGAELWTDYRMADGTLPFEGGYAFIYLEGSDSTGLELQAYLDANRALIESYVSDGGVLFINAAENDIGTDDIYIGFGDVHILTNYSANVVAVDPEHPIWQGPYTPVSLTNSGGWFGHADVNSTENTITNIITGDVGDNAEGKIVFGTFTYGSGFVLIGGMTAVDFHSPTENDENVNLFLNMLSYVGTTDVNELNPNNAPVINSSGGSMGGIAILLLTCLALLRRYKHIAMSLLLAIISINMQADEVSQQSNR